MKRRISALVAVGSHCCESRLGAGTTVAVVLPAADAGATAGVVARRVAVGQD
jgi:hypothetical protein